MYNRRSIIMRSMRIYGFGMLDEETAGFYKNTTC